MIGAPASPAVHVVSLGCPKNEIDTERILAALAESGWLISSNPADADVILINTCGFIEAARREALTEIDRAVTAREAGICRGVAVTGCLVQLWDDAFPRHCPEVDAWTGLCDPEKVVEACKSALSGTDLACTEQKHNSDEGPRLRITPPHFAYLRIAEGCDNRCAYCNIPTIRGPLRSRSAEDIIAEARELYQDGTRELCLIAQDTSAYGLDLTGRSQLPQLVRSLADLDLFPWIRLLYVHPAHCTDELISTIAETPTVCKYIDLPLQHIDDEILREMNRHVTGDEIRRLIDKLRERIDNLVLRTTFIVGLPGETPDRFETLMDFVKGTRFERLGAFTYSPEEDTPAHTMNGQVAAEEAERRYDILMKTHRDIAFEHARSMVGSRVECVVDHTLPDGRCIGRTGGDAPGIDTIIELSGDNLHDGMFGTAEVTSADGYDLTGVFREKQ